MARRRETLFVLRGEGPELPVEALRIASVRASDALEAATRGREEVGGMSHGGAEGRVVGGAQLSLRAVL